MATELSFIDRLIYRFILIPRTRQALLDQGSVILDSTLRRPQPEPRRALFRSEAQSAGRLGQGPPGPGVSAPRQQRRWPRQASRCSRSTVPPATPSIRPTRPRARCTRSQKSARIAHCWTSGPRPRARPDAGARRRAPGNDQGWRLHRRPVSGIWLRGPYLHNGSVPSLRDLLEPQAQRRSTFFPGNDVIDAENVGFLSTHGRRTGPAQVPRATIRRSPATATPAISTPPGSRAPDKDALLEYLKTL